METEPVKEVSNTGSYPLFIVPNRYRTALVCVHDIVSAGHVVTFTTNETLVSDVGGAYTLRIPRILDPRDWRVPLHLLQRSASPTYAPNIHSTTHSSTTIMLDNQPPNPLVLVYTRYPAVPQLVGQSTSTAVQDTARRTRCASLGSTRAGHQLSTTLPRLCPSEM